MRRRDFIAATDKENLLKLAEAYRTSSNELNVSNAPKMSVVVKGFGCRPHEGRRREFGGRRPKASKGGNRA
jgi:hypothetical protein